LDLCPATSQFPAVCVVEKSNAGIVEIADTVRSASEAVSKPTSLAKRNDAHKKMIVAAKPSAVRTV
jgi:hypothetical protein